MLGSTELKLAIELLRKENRFPEGITGQEMGQIIDFYNQTVVDKNEKEYTQNVSSMNKYYAKLFLWGLQYGFDKKYDSSTILVNKKEKIDKD